ncbi:hypothetical protein [Weissella muntiaci]|uniref:hypothetical protein n=1 Tax=Weissella muntiaci TaxID=2508881 RepID=UPI001CA36C6F|nr:hypothetical protein [Weissella muntiaci]
MPKHKRPVLISTIALAAILVIALFIYFLNANNKIDSKIESPTSSKQKNAHSKKSKTQEEDSSSSEKASLSSVIETSNNNGSASTSTPASNTAPTNNTDASSSSSPVYTSNEDSMLSTSEIRKRLASYSLSFADPYVQQFDPNSYTMAEIPGGFDIKFTNSKHVVAIDNKNDTYTFTNESNNQQITQDLGYIMTGAKAPVNN